MRFCDLESDRPARHSVDRLADDAHPAFAQLSREAVSACDEQARGLCVGGVPDDFEPGDVMPGACATSRRTLSIDSLSSSTSEPPAVSRSSELRIPVMTQQYSPRLGESGRMRASQGLSTRLARGGVPAESSRGAGALAQRHGISASSAVKTPPYRLPAAAGGTRLPGPLACNGGPRETSPCLSPPITPVAVGRGRTHARARSGATVPTPATSCPAERQGPHRPSAGSFLPCRT